MIHVENSHCTKIYPPHTHYSRLSKEFCWQLSKMAGFFIFLFFWSGSGICAGISWIAKSWVTSSGSTSAIGWARLAYWGAISLPGCVVHTVVYPVMGWYMVVLLS